MIGKQVFRISAFCILAVGLIVATPPVQAGVIERACLSSDRKAASRALCNCVQQVADITLNRGDQKRASTFFRDPDRAQRVRQSDRASDERFWKRYKGFTTSAQSYCRALSR